MKAPPITKWESGLKVRTKRLIRQVTQPDVPEDIVAYLGHYNRFQDGVECWDVWTVDPVYLRIGNWPIKMFGACHTDLEPIGGKIAPLTKKNMEEDFNNYLDDINAVFSNPSTD